MNDVDRKEIQRRFGSLKWKRECAGVYSCKGWYVQRDPVDGKVQPWKVSSDEWLDDPLMDDSDLWPEARTLKEGKEVAEHGMLRSAVALENLQEIQRRFAGWIRRQKTPTLGKLAAYLDRVAEQFADATDEATADSPDIGKDASAYLLTFAEADAPEENTVGYRSEQLEEDRELVADVMEWKWKEYPLKPTKA